MVAASGIVKNDCRRDHIAPRQAGASALGLERECADHPAKRPRRRRLARHRRPARRRAPRRAPARHARSAQPRLPARHGRLGRASRAGRGFVLELARDDVSLRARDDAGPGRGRGGAALCRDAGSGLFARGRVPLSPSRPRRRALCRHCRDGGPHRRRRAADGHRPHLAAGLLCPWRLWRHAARSRPEAVCFVA